MAHHTHASAIRPRDLPKKTIAAKASASLTIRRLIEDLNTQDRRLHGGVPWQPSVSYDAPASYRSAFVATMAMGTLSSAFEPVDLRPAYDELTALGLDGRHIERCADCGLFFFRLHLSTKICPPCQPSHTAKYERVDRKRRQANRRTDKKRK